jgi:RimJ/RimL family protein N-acetyltransferase
MSNFRFKYLHKDTCSNQDLEFLRTTRNNPLVLENVFHNKKITRVEQEFWYRNDYQTNLDYKIYIIYDESKESPIGYVQIYIESIVHKRCRCNYVISPDYLDCNYDTKVIKQIIKFIKNMEYEFHRLSAYILETDENKLNNYIKCGFEVDGYVRDYVEKNGAYIGINILSYLL